MKTGWSAADIADLTGRTAVVTGARGCIGYEIAATIAARGAPIAGHLVCSPAWPVRAVRMAGDLAQLGAGAGPPAPVPG